MRAHARYACYDLCANDIRAAFFCKNFLHSILLYAKIIPVESSLQNRGALADNPSAHSAGNSQFVNRKSSIVNLSTPRGITVEEAATLLRYSTSTVRRLIAAHILVAWKPGGPNGRKYLVDEIALARWQAASIARARTEAAPVQAALLQGELPLW